MAGVILRLGFGLLIIGGYCFGIWMICSLAVEAMK